MVNARQTTSFTRLGWRVALFSELPVLIGLLLLIHFVDIGPFAMVTGLAVIVVASLLTTTLAVRELVVLPIHLALSMVYRITEGDFSVRSGTPRADEVGVLIEALNDLAGLFESRVEVLRGSERRHRLLYEQNPAGLFQTRPDGRVLECNAAAVRLLGYDSATEVKLHNASVFYANPDEREQVMERLRRERLLSNFPMRFRRKDGRELPVLVNMTLHDERGETSIDGLFVELGGAPEGPNERRAAAPPARPSG